jgi:CheY-like chemotaxis protein
MKIDVCEKNGSGIFAEDRIVQPSDAASSGQGHGWGSAALRILLRDEGDTGESKLSQSPESIDPDMKLPSLNGLRVLAVDDEPDLRELLTILLTHYGAAVTTVGSVQAAVKAFQEAPDVLLSDIGMPHGDGYALIRQIRALEGDRPDKVPAIALTCYTQPEDRCLALTVGYQMYLTKPVEPLELVTAIANLAKRR